MMYYIPTFTTANLIRSQSNQRRVVPRIRNALECLGIRLVCVGPWSNRFVSINKWQIHVLDSFLIVVNREFLLLAVARKEKKIKNKNPLRRLSEQNMRRRRTRIWWIKLTRRATSQQDAIPLTCKTGTQRNTGSIQLLSLIRGEHAVDMADCEVEYNH